MLALGIDLGGTKIAGQIFDPDWNVVASRRIATPDSYEKLLADMAGLCQWADDQAGIALPVGLGVAGLLHPQTGLLTAANHVADGQPLPADITRAAGRAVTFLNDGQALALSEAKFGAGQGHSVVLSLVIGTGVSAAIVDGGVLRQGHSATLGEIGHIAAPAHVLAASDLPLVRCGCGAVGCTETLLSGAGLTRIDNATSGHSRSPETLVVARATDPDAAKAWDIWCALAGDLLRTLTRTVDADCIVLGGGLSQVPGIAEDVMRAARLVQFAGFDVAPVKIATGGDASGARGAAYAAVQAAGLADG